MSHTSFSSETTFENFHNDDCLYLNTKKVNGIEGEASSFLGVGMHFKAEEESSDGGMGRNFKLSFHSRQSAS